MQTYLPFIEPHPHLKQWIFSRIALARRRAARVKVTLFGLSFLASGAALIPATLYAAHEFYASGFYDYFSFLFSDSAVALAHWQELSLSLVEALPSLAILLLVTFMVVFAWSLLRAIRNARIAFAPRNLFSYGNA